MYLDYIIKCPLFIDLGEQQIYDIVRHLKTDIYNPDGKALEISFIATSENTFFNASEGIQITFEKNWYGSLISDRFIAKHDGANYEFQKK